MRFVMRKMKFGGDGGGYVDFSNTSGQHIALRGGGALDRIQIGGDKAGGEGGSNQGSGTIPKDSVCQLTRIDAGKLGDCWVIKYLELICGETTVTAGTKGGGISEEFQPPIDVKITGAYGGMYVDAIVFEIVN